MPSFCQDYMAECTTSSDHGPAVIASAQTFPGTLVEQLSDDRCSRCTQQVAVKRSNVLVCAEQRVSTSWMRMAVLCTPCTSLQSQQEYFNRQHQHSEVLARLQYRPQWRTSCKTPRLLTPAQPLVRIEPPDPQRKPWAKRKPPSAHF
jgi:hypothetical protein